MVKFPPDFTAGPDVHHHRTPLHMAVLHDHAPIVRCILSSPGVSPLVANAADRFGYTLLQLAVRSRHESIVRILMQSSLLLPDCALAATGPRDELAHDCDGFTLLHLAIVKLLLQRSIRSGTCNIQATTWQGLTALDIAKQRKQEPLVDLLECFDVNWLELECQKSVNSMNAILMGAALVATVAFASCQQPPLGIPTWDSSLIRERERQVQVRWFFMCIAVSFSCSVVSLVIGTAPVIPSRGVPSKREVKQLRKSGLRASTFLFLAIFFLMFSFQLSGLIVYPVVTPSRTGIQMWGNLVLLALPLITAAYILRYVVLPKRLDRGKRWVMAVFFVVALGLLITIGFLVFFLIYLDTLHGQTYSGKH